MFEEEDEHGAIFRRLRIRSKGQVIDPEVGEKMFTEGIETIKRLAPLMRPGYTYRGEYLKKPLHNALAYERVPVGHWILFDILDGEESYLPYLDVMAEARRLGLEVVPAIHTGDLTPDMLKGFLNRTSILGGQKIEGVVVKPLDYKLLGGDGKVVFGKYVSKEFQEVHAKAWKRDNPGPGDIRDALVEELRSPARWQKAIIHAKEEGRYNGDVTDIGPLVKRIQEDVFLEETEHIKSRLFNWAKAHVTRGVVRGFPEWYKAKLVADLEPEGVLEANDALDQAA